MTLAHALFFCVYEVAKQTVYNSSLYVNASR